jgi:hypothetical protein
MDYVRVHTKSADQDITSMQRSSRTLQGRPEVMLIALNHRIKYGGIKSLE